MFSSSFISRFLLRLGILVLAPVFAWPQGTYTTNFPLTENPISESGRWINGKVTGLDWANVRTSGGLAFGTQSGSDTYADSTALLSGTWGPTQTVTATVHSVNQGSCTGGCFEEVELRLRSALSAHRATGYEVNFRCQHDGSQYTQVVRWNGALGDFTELDGRTGPGINDGDTVKATISGSTISVYINNNLIFSANDSTFTSGSPGMGFYLQGGSSNLQADYGFTSYSATDGTGGGGLAPPSNLTAVPH